MNRKLTLKATLALLGAAVSGAVRAVVAWLLERGTDGA